MKNFKFSHSLFEIACLALIQVCMVSAGMTVYDALYWVILFLAFCVGISGYTDGLKRGMEL